ncbi:disulfide bond formation protein B [Pseudomonas sp. X10]
MAAVLIMAVTVCLEYSQGLTPCPLCYSQRLFLAAFGLVCLCAVIHSPARRGACIYGVLALICAGSGAMLAARQVWLQSSPMALMECRAPLGQIIENIPWSQVLKMMVLGSKECTAIHWSFLDLTLPEWSLLAFLLLALPILSSLLAYRFSRLLRMSET